ncbi:BSP-domain-containing protein [Hypoxylon fuscum]|nr:BSP-domain-containing protein [Hypoxylon fuscum]
MSHSDPARTRDSLSQVGSLEIHLTVSPEDENKDKDPPKIPSAMPLPPETTPVPKPVFMPGMSHRTEAPAPTQTQGPAPSALPAPPNDGKSAQSQDQDQSPKTKEEEEELPRLRLHVQDIAHPGSAIFLSAVNASAVLRSSIHGVLQHLYANTHPLYPLSRTPYPRPRPRSVTLILRDMDGVAYTTGSDLDSDHKEIHFSLRYIAGIAPASRQTAEITGVITHELVHCYQWNGKGSAPGGLIEGIADWVRLQCNLAPPHWKREVGSKWDAGYQHTAYFLQYLEERFGEGTVVRVNNKLMHDKYEEKAFWTELIGRPIEQLFDDYKKTLGKGEQLI